MVIKVTLPVLPVLVYELCCQHVVKSYKTINGIYVIHKNDTLRM